VQSVGVEHLESLSTLGFEAIVDAFTERQQCELGSNWGEMMLSNDAIRTPQTVSVVDHQGEVRALARRVEGVGYFVDDLCRFPYSVGALAFALLVLAGVIVFHINVFNLPVVDVIGIERSEVGRIMIAFLFIVPAFFVDRVAARQRSHEQQLRAEQLR
jgi:hypothetical protein